jgi:enterobacteria phage integrase
MKRRRLPPHVEANTVKGHTYLSFRIRRQNGPRIRLPDDPTSEEFRHAYAGAMGSTQPVANKKDSPDSISAKITAYMKSAAYTGLSDSSKDGYSSRLEQIRADHGHRAFSGLTKERIETFILAPLANKPGAQLDTLKKLRILINHFKLTPDPTAGIKRPKSKEIRSWTDREMAAYEKRWPIGTKQRTAYALMLNMGAARIDTHLLTWNQVDDGVCYRRHKTGVQVDMDVSDDLAKALAATPRNHVVAIHGRRVQPLHARSNQRRRPTAQLPAARASQDAWQAPGRRWLQHARHHGRARSHDIGRSGTLHARC